MGARKVEARDVRNRAVTDILEPGSSIKPFVVAAALESGRYNESSRSMSARVSSRSARRSVIGRTPQGVLDLAGILAKTSNVGMAKISQQLEPRSDLDHADRLGFGHDDRQRIPRRICGDTFQLPPWKVEQIASSPMATACR